MEDNGRCPYCAGNVATIGKDDAKKHEDWMHSLGQVGEKDEIKQCLDCQKIHAVSPLGTVARIGSGKQAFVAVL